MKNTVIYWHAITTTDIYQTHKHVNNQLTYHLSNSGLRAKPCRGPNQKLKNCQVMWAWYLISLICFATAQSSIRPPDANQAEAPPTCNDYLRVRGMILSFLHEYSELDAQIAGPMTACPIQPEARAIATRSNFFLLFPLVFRVFEESFRRYWCC